MQNEEKLREVIRESIKVYAQRRNMLSPEILEEQKARKAIKKLLAEKASTAPAPNDTLEGVLRDLLGDIIPQIRLKYVKLQTSPQERQGFMDYFVPATKDLIDIARGTKQEEQPEELDEEETIKLDTSDRFIDVSDGSKKPTKEPAPEEDKQGLNGYYERGQNLASQALTAVKKRLQQAAVSEIVPEEYEEFDTTLEANLRDWFKIWNRNPTKEENSDIPQPDPDFDATATPDETEDQDTTDQDISQELGTEPESDLEQDELQEDELFEEFGSYFQE